MALGLSGVIWPMHEVTAHLSQSAAPWMCRTLLVLATGSEGRLSLPVPDARALVDALSGLLATAEGVRP